VKIGAYVLIKLKAGLAEEVLKSVRTMTEVQRAHMVTGIYDVILYVEAADLKVLGELVAERIHEIDGVSSTVTCIVVA